MVLIVDEAHKLNPLSLELLRILLNYETNEAKLLQLVLLGQMELLPVLQGMPNLADRISLKCTLGPLTLEETRQMIDFRLSEAGYRSLTPLFLDEAIETVYESAQGYPRKISMLCHQVLRLSVMQKRSPIDRDLVEEFIKRELEAGWPSAKILQKNNY